MAKGYNGDNILVNDPGYTTTSYTLPQIVNGNTGVYTINKLPNFINNWWLDISEYFTGPAQLEFPPVKIPHENGNIRIN